METFVDLFCGGGLGARGAVNAGLKPLLAVDLWDIACKTYKSNFPSATVLNSKIQDVIPELYVKPGSIDLILASPECTNHSIAKGNAPIDEESRDTAFYTLEWIERLRPRWFIIENVKEMRAWNRYKEFVNKIGEIGYKFAEIVIDSSELGAPQSRTRLFLIGSLEQAPSGISIKISKKNRKTVRDILDPHGTWAETLLAKKDRAKSTLKRAKNAIKELGPNAEFLIVYYGSGGERSWQLLDEPLRTVTTIDRFALVRKKSSRYVMRMLQPRELARAMSLPDHHLLPWGTRRDKVKICGNGICSIVIQKIIESIRELENERADLSPKLKEIA